ncbi:MAG: hypothetical protein J6S80_04010 [Alphaproteobacteria bacterium]|nr:hypothetical protein [Alphaproteobacteria bacterium]
MNEPTELQQECLNNLRNWPRRRCDVKSSGDSFEYNGIVIEQTIGKDKYKNDATIYKVTLNGVNVPNDRAIDVQCRQIFRRYFKMDILRRENTKEAIMGGTIYVGVIGLAMALFVLGFNKCGGSVPVMDDDYGLYMMSKNNTKSYNHVSTANYSAVMSRTR